MIESLTPLLGSRSWILLSLTCALFSLYEAISKVIAGHELEGAADFVLTAVFLINFINRFVMVKGYIAKL